jgi:hypothetical protein
MRAYEAAFSRTSTDHAPWWIIPADHKFVTRALIAAIITRTITSLDLRYPQLSPKERHELEEARRLLEAE